MFPADKHLRRTDDTLMLGDFLLAKPVTRPMHYLPHSQPIQAEQTEEVYLPAGCDWYELHTGRCLPGGQVISTPAPLDVVPLYVRAGAILPWGAQADSTQSQAEKPLEIVVFPGADGQFTLYQDAGDGYGYEAGQCMHLPMVWNDTKGELTLGRRSGSYPGMKDAMQLKVRLAGREAQEVLYTGENTIISL